MASNDMSTTREKQEREGAEDADEGEAMASSYLSNSLPADGKQQERNNVGERILLPESFSLRANATAAVVSYTIVS